MTGRHPARVLWLIKGLGRGGAERLLSLSVPHLRRDRYQVEVAYLLPHKRALVDEIAGRGIPVHCLGGRLGADPSWMWRLWRLLRTGAYDLVHTHSPYPAVAARLLAGRRGPLVVHTEHNVWPRYRLPTFTANAATYGRNRAVIA
ncbi:MAG: glycosyltransferase, partial [Actinomycetota bacterium]|nr:glycosyltransferase [Actinomycetota bacterium]